MYGDGLLYAVIARNLSVGAGSFWAPSFTRTAYAEFFEHPPLGFALEAIAFTLLGDHLFVERVFSFVVFALHAIVIALIWRRVHSADSDWLPVLFWIVPSIVTWAVVNNMLENQQALLTSTAVLMLVSGKRNGALVSSPSALARGAGAGLAIAAAVLTKGPVGFFPLIAPVLFHWLPVSRRPARLWLRTLAMVLAIAGSAALLAAYGPSRDALDTYLDTQVVSALRGERDLNQERVPIFRHVAIGIIARMGALLALIAFFFGRRPRGGRAASDEADSADDRRTALCFLVLALSASLPIAFSPKLAGHYFVPSVPMFALAFASLARRPAEAMLAAWARKPIYGRALFGLAGVLLAASVLVPLLYGPLSKRDEVLMRDLETLGAAIPRDLTIGSCRHPRSAYDWCIHSYVQRWYRISLDARDAPVNGWLLQTDDEPCRASIPVEAGAGGAGWKSSCAAPPSCTAVARGQRLTLFRCP
jgi:4-amino-4-deoxy-L-arabinose transferase-like glycosyltransferase